MPSSVIQNMTRLLSTPGMPKAYSRWLWSSILREEAVVPCATTKIRGWISFSDFWSFHSGILDSERRLIDHCLRRTGSLTPTAIDVGAHLGLFSAELAGRGFAAVHAFEPTPPTFEKLTRNITASPCARGVVRLNRIALGLEEGWVKFEVKPESPATNHVCEWHKNQEPANGNHQVRMTTLDRYCTEHDIGRIDFLKIDTEGFEPYVLEGARKTLDGGRVPFILFEVCPDLLKRAGSNAAQLHRMFTDLGYSPRWVKDDGTPGAFLRGEDLERITLANVVAVGRAEQGSFG